MSTPQSRRKCRCCKKLFRPDYRNRHHQLYCSDPVCRQVSKRASQSRWARRGDTQNYFRGAEHVRRVQEWRKAHPGYWKRRKSMSGQDQAPDCQSVNPEQRSCNVPGSHLGTLQDLCPPFCLAQDPAFLGLISLVTGSTLQDDIVATARQVLLRGQAIQGVHLPKANVSAHEKASDPPGSCPSGSTGL